MLEPSHSSNCSSCFAPPEQIERQRQEKTYSVRINRYKSLVGDHLFKTSNNARQHKQKNADKLDIKSYDVNISPRYIRDFSGLDLIYQFSPENSLYARAKY